VKHVGTDRSPGEESLDCYPGLVVSDGEHRRVSGTITVGRTRLPVWCLISEVIYGGWSAAVEDYEPDMTASQAAEFFYNLMAHRGEFGRLILILADVERCSTLRWDWTETRKHIDRLADQLERCLKLLRPDEN
jgi:hypothetical protein